MMEITLRFCGPGDDAALRCIAERDSAEPLPAGALAAEIDGELIAAISIESRRVVADPFHSTADAVDLLRRSADQVRKTEGGGRWSLRRAAQEWWATAPISRGAPRSPLSGAPPSR